jgi:uncharacterized protein (TIGR02246 family)
MQKLKQRVVPLAFVATLLLLGMAVSADQSTQPASKTAPTTAADPELQKLADDYSAAWSKGDAAALAALYTADALYIDSGMVLMKGRSEIEATFKQRFAGELKGTTITVSPGESRLIAPQVRISEGAWQISGPGISGDAATAQPHATAATPTAGRYLNTYVREQGRWLIAGTAGIPEPPKAP